MNPMRKEIIIPLIAFILISSASATISAPIVNLTFDNSSNCFYDSSTVHHNFTNQGGVACLPASICKWYGCASFNATSGDFLNTTTKFPLSKGMAVEFWLYPTAQVSGAASQAYMQIGNDVNNPQIDGTEGGYGWSPRFWTSGGIIQHNPGDTYTTQDGVWTHYFMQWNNSQYTLWKNGVVLVNSADAYGTLNYTVGDMLRVGYGIYGINLVGYMDEFKLYNQTSFTTTDVVELYDSHRLGTPPDIDVWIPSVQYALPYNWSHPNRTLIPGVLTINITIANQGINASGSFPYNFTLAGVKVCDGMLTIPSASNVSFTCNWTTSYGWQNGILKLNEQGQVADSIPQNNNLSVYIPFLNHPYMHFNDTDYSDFIKPYSSNSANAVANAAYGWQSFFASDAFDTGWTLNDVDPRGRKMRENAMGCYQNNFNMTKDACKNSLEHLKGWANRTDPASPDVQALHEISNVAFSWDLMFRLMNQSDYDTLSAAYASRCNYITNLPNTRPDQDSDVPEGGNGFGFGSGMATLCYAMLGQYSGNPLVIQQNSQQYWGISSADAWMTRETHFLQGRKNDSDSLYQEGIGYKQYAEPHIVENLLFEKRMNLNSLSQYQNAMCAMGKEAIRETMDYNSNGAILRGFLNLTQRRINRGDDNTWDTTPSNTLFPGWSVYEFYGVLCDDQNVKQALLYFRNLTHVKEQNTGYNALSTYPDVYLMPYLSNQTNGTVPGNIEALMPHYTNDRAQGIVTFRANYTFLNDTIIQIDGGEEVMGGHAFAQGFMLYALGIDWLTYGEDSYNDDLYSETTRNTISFVNTSLPYEGYGGTWQGTYGTAIYNRYYGGSSLQGTYPNYRQYPKVYGGDMENEFGTRDGLHGGVYNWYPMRYSTKPVEEFYIVWNNLLARAVRIDSANSTVFDNNLFYWNETSPSVDGYNFTLNTSTKFMKVWMIWSNSTPKVSAWMTNMTFCFHKTDCSGSWRGNGKYGKAQAFWTSDSTLRYIRAYEWGLKGAERQLTTIYGVDNGLQDGTAKIVFDTNNDQNVSLLSINASGWGLVYDEVGKEFMVFNSTLVTNGTWKFFRSNASLSFHSKWNTTVLTVQANTNQLNQYIEMPTPVSVTFNATPYLSAVDNLSVKQNGITIPSTRAGGEVTFTMLSSIQGDVFTIQNDGNATGPEPPAGGCDVLAYVQNTTTYSCTINGCVFLPGTCVNNLTRSGSAWYGNQTTWVNS
jgi:hypothetical protein